MKCIPSFSFNQPILIEDLLNLRSICDAKTFILMLELYIHPQKAHISTEHRQISNDEREQLNVPKKRNLKSNL